MLERLAKAIARAGVCSRRKAEVLIRDGKVKVDGKAVTDVGTKVDTSRNKIEVSGKPIKISGKIYYLLNKPPGYVTTVKDKHAPRTVLDLLPGKDFRVFPVGRLDKNSRGLLLLTNDGELAFRLTHPKFEVPKTYLVRLDRELTDHDLKKLLSGVMLEDGLAKASGCRILDKKRLEIVLKEGKKREIRRMLESLGYKVGDLKRISFGPLRLGKLKEGKARMLSEKELRSLKKI